MEIKMMKVQDVHPYEKNPRKNDASVDYVANSIKEFGFKVPIIVDKKGVIVCGHTRYKAAKKLEMKTVPVICADDLNDEQIKAFRLADNKVGESSEWDDDLLADALASLPDFDMTDFGFDPIDDLDSLDDISEPDDDFEVPKETKVKEGDLYKLADHRLMCGDSSSSEDFRILMGGCLADMVFTDPPYGVAIGSKNAALNKIQRSGRCTEDIEGDTLSADELYPILQAAMKNCRESCKDDAAYYVTSPQGGDLGLMMMTMMKDAGLPVRHILIWEKNCATFSLGRLDYDYQHEPIFYTWTKSHHNYRKGKFRTTIWTIDKPRHCDLHPTMKPVELVANCMADATKEGDIVLDAFGGSGTTIIAAEQMGRKAIVMEKDPKYVDVIITRWEEMTGKKAELIS